MLHGFALPDAGLAGADRRDPRVGNVRAFLDEFSRAFANDGMPYPNPDGALRIHPGDYPSATFATEADQGRGISGAARFFTDSGRRFELLAQYGGKPAPNQRCQS